MPTIIGEDHLDYISELPNPSDENPLPLYPTLDYSVNSGIVIYSDDFLDFFTWEVSTLADAEYIANNITTSITPKNVSGGSSIEKIVNTKIRGNKYYVQFSIQPTYSSTFYWKGDIDVYYNNTQIGSVRNLTLIGDE